MECEMADSVIEGWGEMKEEDSITYTLNDGWGNIAYYKVCGDKHYVLVGYKWVELMELVV
jgi:hypothetical protein